MKAAIKLYGENAFIITKWVLWGLRWLAVIVFSALFITGILVELPWKVLVCLAVVPIVGVFCPKKIQPWVWAGMLIMIAAVFVWIRLPETKDSEWKVYQYDTEAEKLLVERHIDPQANAATAYTALLNSYDESIFLYPAISGQTEYTLFNSPWDREDYPMIAEWLATYQPGIDELIKITEMPECCFPIPKTLLDTQTQMKRLNQMKGWARLTLWSANHDLARGDGLKALEKQAAVLKMANHLYQQRTLFGQSAAFDIEYLAFRAISQYIIDDCDNQQTLNSILQSFEDLDTGWAKNWPDILEREKLILKNIMGLLYEQNEEGDIRIARSAMYTLQEGLGYPPRKLFFHQQEMDRLAVIGLWLSLPNSPKGMAHLIDKRFDYYSLQAQKGDTPPSLPIQYSWRMGLNITSLIDWYAIERVQYFWALHNKNMRHQTIVDLIHIFSELKKYYLIHDDWPASLVASQLDLEPVVLIDSVYGKPFVYQKTESGFNLYSLGPNGIDDNGVNSPLQKKDDIVFWPRPASPDDFADGLIAEKTIPTP